MPIFRVAIYKQLDGLGDEHEWSNVYHVDAADQDAAVSLASDISIIEQDVHKDYVVFARSYVKEEGLGTPEGVTNNLIGNGQVTGDPTLRLPGFNTIRATFFDGVGRPDQKYLRLPLQEDDIVDGTINVTVNNLINLSYIGPLVSLAGLVSSDGVPYTGGNVYSAIQMRQTGWKRRTRPGFHRGWVPD